MRRKEREPEVEVGAKAAVAVVADGMFTVKEAVEFTKLSRSELYALMGRGELQFLKHGKRRLVPKRAIVELLAGKLSGAN